MLDTRSKPSGPRSRATALGILGVVVLAASGVALLEWRSGTARPTEQVVLTDEARDYLHSLDLDGVEMAAMDNTLGHTLVEVTGTIRNLGQRQVRSMRLNCVFFDVHGIEMHRVLSTIVSSSDGLAPGSARDFRLPFDDIPDGWNQILPSLYIAEIVFD